MALTFDTAPAKMWVANIDTAAAVEAQYNPIEWKVALEAKYVDHEVIGNTYQPRNYTGTKNDTIGPLELLFAAETKAEKADLDHASRFMQSLVRKWRGQLRPPRALFVWPGEASLVVTLDKLALHAKRFNKALGIVELVMSLEFTEARDEQLFGDDVLAKGLLRGSMG